MSRGLSRLRWVYSPLGVLLLFGIPAAALASFAPEIASAVAVPSALSLALASALMLLALAGSILRLLINRGELGGAGCLKCEVITPYWMLPTMPRSQIGVNAHALRQDGPGGWLLGAVAALDSMAFLALAERFRDSLWVLAGGFLLVLLAVVAIFARSSFREFKRKIDRRGGRCVFCGAPFEQATIAA